MTAKTLPQINKDSSKADEIAFLEAVAALVPEGTYLSSLFTRDFVGWVAAEIRSDFCPDLLGHWQNDQSGKVEIIKGLQNDAATLMDALEHSKAELENSKTQYNNLKQMFDSRGERIEQLSNWSHELEGQNANQEMEIRRMKGYIVELKAKIFDLEHPELQTAQQVFDYFDNN